MSLKPYPGLPPNISEAPIIGGRHRACFVIEFRGLECLDEIQKVAIRERLEAYAERIRADNATLENYVVAADNQFDYPLSVALRLCR